MKPLPRLSEVTGVGFAGGKFDAHASSKATEEWAKRMVEDLSKRLRALEELLENVSLPAGGYIRFTEFDGTTDVPAPSDNQATLFVKDNGAGKEQLVVLFNTGAVQVIATEP